MNKDFLTITETARFLNVSSGTLRRWEKEGKIVPENTLGGHRRYNRLEIEKMMGYTDLNKSDEVLEKYILLYSRVSSQDQKKHGDLDRQSNRLIEYCKNNDIEYKESIVDVGSGLNDKRVGFNKVTNDVLKGKVSKLIIENKDRLTRFQYRFIEKVFNSFNCEIIVIDDVEVKTSEDELVTDMMTLLASFSGKYYGRRSSRRKKENKNKDK